MFAKKTIAAALIGISALAAVPATANAAGFGIEFGYGGGGYGGGHHGGGWQGGPGGWNGGGWQGGGWQGGGHHQRLSPQEVRWMLQDRGYHRIRIVDDRGPVYQLRASKNGRTFFIVVSARTGEILSRNRV